MKRLLCLIVIVGIAATAVYSQETVVLPGSNQNQTTLGFEMNEYDYLVNPLYISLLANPWLFFALDNDVNQLGANIVGDGFRAGWALGGDLTPVFLANYRTVMNNLDSTDPADNIEITRTGYDTAAGLYATIVETVNEDSKRKQQIHDLVLHGGLSLSETLALAFQLALAMDTWTVQSVDYTNTYTNTAAASAASLTTKGDLTETDISMRAATDNSYRLDAEAGLALGNIQTRIVVGTGWYNPHSANNTYEEIVTVYDAGGGLDDTVRDRETITTYAGQYTTGGGVPTPSFAMGSTAINWAEFFRLALGSETMLPLGEAAVLTVPFDLQYDLYAGSPQTALSTTTVLYDDASATSLETSRDATTTTTSLARTLDLRAATGTEIGTSVMPSDNTELHLGAAFDFVFDAARDTKTQVQQQRFQQDNDGDGAYTTVGTDVDYTYLQSGYEEQNSVFQYDFDLTVETAVSYSPVPVLTFHAGASAGLGMDLTSTSTLTTGDAGFVYEQYTDNLDSANSYVQRQQDASANDSIPSTLFSTDFTFNTDAEFGFTLNFSDNFMVDARSVFSGNVGFAEFSVLGMYSY